MLMTDQQASELAKPGVGSFDDPTPLVAAQFAPIFVTPLLIVFPVRHDQLDASFLQSLAQGIRIVGGVGDHPFRLLSRTAFGLRNRDFLERGFRKRNFVRRGTFQPNSQRKTLTVDQYHPLCPLAPLGFSDGRAPFFAGAKLPSRKVSSHFSRPSLSSAPSRVRHAFSQTPSSSHCLSRRRQVEGEENSSGKNRHAAPCKNPQNTFETRLIRCPGSAPIIPPSPGRGQHRLHQFPLLVGQQLLPPLHARSSSANPPHS